MDFNRFILTTIALASIFLFVMGLVSNSIAQVNQTSNNQTADNKSSLPASSSSSDTPQTSRINGSSIATVNENAKLINNP